MHFHHDSQVTSVVNLWTVAIVHSQQQYQRLHVACYMMSVIWANVLTVASCCEAVSPQWYKGSSIAVAAAKKASYCY